MTATSSPAGVVPPVPVGDQVSVGEAGNGAAVGISTPPTAAPPASPPPPDATPDAALHIVCGLDLSIASTGIAHVYSRTAVVDRIVSKPHHDAGYDQRAQRLRLMRSTVLEAIGTPRLLVIEAPSYGSTGKHAHDLIGLWWLVVTALQARGIPVAYMAPATRAKYLTGSGRTGKDEVLAAAVARFPNVHVTRNDEADALALAAAGADWLGCPLVELPKTHRAALDAVHWPLIGEAA